MRLNTGIIERIDMLLAKADSLHMGRTEGDVDYAAYAGWMTQCLSFFVSLLEKDHVIIQQFEFHVRGPNVTSVRSGTKIIESLREDIEKGYLTSFAALVSADVFADFLEMAEYLLSESYRDPAASVCGAALETGLRKVLDLSGHTAKESDRLQSLNQQCLNNQIYNKIRYDEVKAWTAIRDHAAHGEYKEYDSDQVKRMIEGVRGLLSEYLK